MAHWRHSRGNFVQTFGLLLPTLRSSNLSGVSANRRNSASCDETGRILFSFFVHFSFAFCRRSSQLLLHFYDSGALAPSPDLLEILEPLEIVFLFQPAFDPEFRKDCHHLSQGNPGQFRSPTERGHSLLISLDREQDSPTRHHVANRFGQIAPLLFGDLLKEIVVLAIHANAHRFAHGFASSFRLASSIMESLYRPCLARDDSFSRASDSSSNPLSRPLIRMPTAVVNATPNNLQALIPFLSSMARTSAFSLTASAMASASPLPRLKSACNLPTRRRFLTTTVLMRDSSRAL